MSDLLNLKTANTLASFYGLRPRHPLISIINFDELGPVPSVMCYYSIYALYLIRRLHSPITYGAGIYNYADDTLICMAPGQVCGTKTDGSLIEPGGWGLLFHPDLIRGTALGSVIKRFSFFDYKVNEALHMNADETEMFEAALRRLDSELTRHSDAQQRNIIISYLYILLEHAMRFYNRQFASECPERPDVLMRFERALEHYYEASNPPSGLPSVQSMANDLHMSPNYLSDLLKKTTGKTALQHMHSFLVARAKDLLSSGMSVSETAYSLGFDYPQHFTRLFKRHEQLSPAQWTAGRR